MNLGSIPSSTESIITAPNFDIINEHFTISERHSSMTPQEVDTSHMNLLYVTSNQRSKQSGP